MAKSAKRAPLSLRLTFAPLLPLMALYVGFYAAALGLTTHCHSETSQQGPTVEENVDVGVDLP